MPPIPEVNTVNQFPKDAAHAAHVATSRYLAPKGDTETPRCQDRNTSKPVAHDLVEPGASHTLPTIT